MLIWEEVSATVDEAMKTPPDELRQVLANYIPQNCMDQLMDDIYDHSMIRTDDEEASQLLTAQFLMGFHVAWYLATKVMKK